MGEVGAHGVEDAEARSVEITPVGDFGLMEPVEGVELMRCGAGAQNGNGGWGGVRKRGQSQKGLFIFHDEHSRWPGGEKRCGLGERNLEVGYCRGVVEIAEANTGVAAAQS